MVEKSLAHERAPSTRELVADGPFCQLLAQDMGLKTSTVRTGLIGEPKVRCIRVVEWVMRNAPDDPERRARLLLWWAKKRKAGAFRPDDDPDLAARVIRDEVPASERLDAIAREREEERFMGLARALAGMWQENPESLAGAIRALERSRNGRS